LLHTPYFLLLKRGGQLLKTISKGLILALVIQFALILPFVNIIGAEKIKAQTEGPVTPNDPILFLRATDATYNTVTITASYGASSDPREFVFDSPTEIKTSDFNYNIPRYDRVANDSDEIKSYKLNRPTLYCHGTEESNEIYLITVKYNDDPENKVRFSGIYAAYRPSTDATLKYQMVFPNGSVEDWCRNLHQNNFNDANIIKMAHRQYLNKPVVPHLSVDQKEQTCNDIQSNWEQLKQDARELFNPAPGSTGESQNENWIITGGMWNAAAWWFSSKESADAFCDWVEGLIGLPPDRGAALYSIKQQKLAPSETGKFRYKSIMERGKKLKESIDSILASDDPTCNDIQLKKFKWAAPENEVYSDLNSFREDISDLLKAVELFFKTYQEPVETAGEKDICGSNMGVFSGRIFQWLFCQLAVIIHGTASSIMTKATQWLTDSIGVDINMKFKDPAKDDYPTGGGGTETPAPGAGTPTPGTETPTPRTATPMDISETIQFDTEADYLNAKRDGGSISVKVKNNDAVSAIINVATAISWGEWSSNHRVSVRFTTTENIPVEWTSVRIYSEDASGDLRFRFSINYPPAGNTFTAISSIE